MRIDDLLHDMWSMAASVLRKQGELPDPILIFFDSTSKKYDMFPANENRELTRLMVKEMISRFHYDVVCMVSEAAYRIMPEGMSQSEVDVFLNDGGRAKIEPIDVAVVRVVTATEQRTSVKRVVRDKKGRAVLRDFAKPMNVDPFYDANLEGVFGTPPIQ